VCLWDRNEEHLSSLPAETEHSGDYILTVPINGLYTCVNEIQRHSVCLKCIQPFREMSITQKRQNDRLLPAFKTYLDMSTSAEIHSMNVCPEVSNKKQASKQVNCLYCWSLRQNRTKLYSK